MGRRLIIEVLIFLLPFAVFALYLAVTADAEREGRRKWPINALFLIGLALAAIGWFAFMFFDRPPTAHTCYTPSRIVNGEVIEGEPYDCDIDRTKLGEPLSKDPGGRVEGAGQLEPTGDSPDED